ncbi:unnamed protein product [Fraxinus pennsylvanica]|uniref:Uncharacterized protein n=1 Tax=Fraxinus pennsylvanica TaxID=56036 RepID=A0AAD1ZYL7_9LAMI|nr:unnamed protein product [Fraxinus pennsylvanica]
MISKIAPGSFKQQSGPRKGKLYCTECGYTSHTTDKCFRLIGFPPGFKSGRNKGINSSSQVHSVASSGEQSFSSMPFTPEQYNQILSLIKPVNVPPIDTPSINKSDNLKPTFQPQCNMTDLPELGMFLATLTNIIATSLLLHQISLTPCVQGDRIRGMLQLNNQPKPELEKKQKQLVVEDAELEQVVKTVG